jgi:triosephosphate isomerase
MRQPFVAGNWKMNGTLSSVAELLSGLKAGIGQVTTAEVAVCAPFVYIPAPATVSRARPSGGAARMCPCILRCLHR